MTTQEQKDWVKDQMHGGEVVQTKSSKEPKEEIVHKYSIKGKGQLREAVIIEGKPYFLKYSETKDSLRVDYFIDEETRRLRPPHIEENPYEPYEFNNAKSLNDYYLPLAKKVTIDSLYQKIKSMVRLFNDIDDFTLNLFSINAIGSYFQDRLSTVHYLFVVGGNGTGKSALGDTFECLGYRVVNITNATEAFWYRVLGSVEFGQVTIVAEEVDKLDENSQILNMLKTGYQPNAKVPRMNSDNDKMDFYYPFCFKILIAERSPREDKARGLLDRGFKINSYKGYPEFKIKEIRNPQGNKIRQKHYDEMMELRKLLLIYKLVNIRKPYNEVDVGLDGRDEELCKPILQLFYTLGACEETLKEVEQTLGHFLNIKNKRKLNSKEALIYPIASNAISKYGPKMDAGQMWQEITDSLEGQIDDKNPNLFHSADYADIYRSSIVGMMTDKFGAELDHKEKGNSIIFNLDIFAKMGKQYDKTKGIQTKLIPDSSDPPDSPSREALIDDPANEALQNLNSNLENLNNELENENMLSYQYESGQSDGSANTHQVQYPPKCYRCDFKPDSKQAYDQHCHNKHPGKAGYPNTASIEADGLEFQAMEWEV